MPGPEPEAPQPQQVRGGIIQHVWSIKGKVCLSKGAAATGWHVAEVPCWLSVPPILTTSPNCLLT